MKRITISLLVVVILGGAAFWWYSPEQVLKRRTVKLLDTLTLEAGSGRGGRRLGVYSLSALLAREVELQTPTIPRANGAFSREELESAYSWLCDQAKQTSFKLQDFDSVEVGGDTADLVFTLDAMVELPTYRPVDGVYQVSFRWRRDDDGWALARAEWDAVGENRSRKTGHSDL